MGGMMSRAKKSIRIGCGVHTYNNLRTQRRRLEDHEFEPSLGYVVR
jgi:hypothetical protein